MKEIIQITDDHISKTINHKESEKEETLLFYYLKNALAIALEERQEYVAHNICSAIVLLGLNK